jgi:hypothetical protein
MIEPAARHALRVSPHFQRDGKAAVLDFMPWSRPAKIRPAALWRQMHPGPLDSISAPGQSRLKNNVLVFFGVALLVFLSRAPFLQAGYGNDSDAWRIANAARHIGATGRYEASRLPGYPVQELACSVIHGGGPLALNGATALLSAFGAAFFALSLRALGCKDYVLASLALAFTPVVFINSTNSMDYVWALAFIFASLYYALRRLPLAAGVFLGLAIGCRMTSALMFPPFCVMLAGGGGPRSHNHLRRLLVFSAGAFLLGGVAYVPVILKYGLGFFTFYKGNYPSLPDVLGKATVAVWGLIGLLAIAGSLRSALLRREVESSIPGSWSRRCDLAWAMAIVIYGVAYLRLPYQSGYLIPAVPFVLLLLGRILRRRLFLFVCFALLLSPFLLSVHAWEQSTEPPGERMAQLDLLNHRIILALPGPIFFDRLVRLADMKYVAQVISAMKRLPPKSVIAAGWWLPELDASMVSGTPSKVDLVYLLRPSKAREYLARGFRLYYLRGIDKHNAETYRVDLVKLGAAPLAVGQTE